MRVSGEMTGERAGAVLFGGKPMTLVGPQLKAGEKLPDVSLVDQTMNPKKISDVKAVVKIVSCVVSLDTGVCSSETERFMKEVGKLGAAVALITVSRDLPFAQQRFCGTTPPAYALFLSDYKDGSFGKAYGTYIKEVALDGRAVFVADEHDKIVYVEYVKDTPTHPHYDAILDAVKKTLGS